MTLYSVLYLIIGILLLLVTRQDIFGCNKESRDWVFIISACLLVIFAWPVYLLVRLLVVLIIFLLGWK